MRDSQKFDDFSLEILRSPWWIWLYYSIAIYKMQSPVEINILALSRHVYERCAFNIFDLNQMTEIGNNASHG